MALQATEYLQRLLANDDLDESEAAETLKAMAEGSVSGRRGRPFDRATLQGRGSSGDPRIRDRHA